VQRWAQETDEELPQYPAGSQGPDEAEALLEDGDGWRSI
jgi:glucose-6-phosphate 1-dehydrogenase